MDIPDAVWVELKKMTKVRVGMMRKNYPADDFPEMESRGLYNGYIAYCNLVSRGSTEKWKPYCYTAIRNGVCDASDDSAKWGKHLRSMPPEAIQNRPDPKSNQTIAIDMLDLIKHRLSGRDFDMFYSYFYENMTYEEIAAKYNTTWTKIRTLILRSQEKVRVKYLLKTRKRLELA